MNIIIPSLNTVNELKELKVYTSDTCDNPKVTICHTKI